MRTKVIAITLTCVICALAIASTVNVGEFTSKLNDATVKITVTKLDNTPIKRIRARDLRRDLGFDEGKFVRFSGVVEFASGNLVVLEGYPVIYIFIVAPEMLEKEFLISHKYEFTGFAIRYNEHRQWEERGSKTIQVYAFDSKYIGEAD